MNYLALKSIFNEDEIRILNETALDLSKEETCEQLVLDMYITNDDLVCSLLQEIYTKITNLSESDWKELQMYLPLDITINDEDFDYIEEYTEEDFK